jgi:hypothetical protein
MPQPPSDAASPEARLSPRIHARIVGGVEAPSDHERMEDAIVAARDAAVAALRKTLNAQPGEAPEVRVMITATQGNPSTEYSHSEVRFAAPDGVAISHHDKVAMALASMKAVSPELYGTMVAGIERGRRFSFGTLRARFRAVAR